MIIRSTELSHSSPDHPIHLDVKSPYTANLCPLSGWADFAGFGKDFGESIGELIKTMAGGAIRQRAPEHLDGMLGEEERFDDTVQTAAR